MAKKRSKRETRTSFTFPSLHQDVSDAVSDEITRTWFNENGNNENSNRNYTTHVMGKFKCKNYRCSNVIWSSKKVAILIRGYPRNGYDAIVFNQRCGSCNGLGSFTLDEDSYIQRITYRLKKWAGVRMEQQPSNGRRGPPHKEDLCEGCRQGYCQQR